MYRNEKINTKQYSLVGNWFHKIKMGEINNPILLCIGLTYETEKLIKDNIQHISHNQEYEKFFTIGPLKNLRFLENDYERNHILHTNRTIDFKLLANINRPIICIVLDTAINDYLPIDIRFDDLILNCDKYTNKPILQAKEEYASIIKGRSPKEVLQQNTSAIRALLYFYINNRYILFNNISKILFRGYQFDLEKDLNYLSEKRILTSRLAIIIYKISTLSNDNDKFIGNYYSEKLGISSEKKTCKLFDINAKCYDLNKSPFINNFEIEGVIDA